LDKKQRRELGIKRARRLLRIYREADTGNRTNGYYDEGGEYEKHLIHTRKPCSCAMCGNPRKYFGEKTRQEIEAVYNEIDEVKELNCDE